MTLMDRFGWAENCLDKIRRQMLYQTVQHTTPGFKPSLGKSRKATPNQKDNHYEKITNTHRVSCPLSRAQC